MLKFKKNTNEFGKNELKRLLDQFQTYHHYDFHFDHYNQDLKVLDNYKQHPLKNNNEFKSNKSEVTTELCSYQQLTCLVWPENYGGSHFVFAQFKGRNWKAQHFNKEIFSDFQT